MADPKRGPVEELIAKRLRPLNKKIQRFRGYTSKAPADLNDDQRAALASLPQLEAAARELEDLSRAVEDAELVAAAKIREEREAAERAFAERVAAATAEFQLATAARLASFLTLHALLRPARPDDHENLTFAPLALPLRLQDEVRATDILRVARMYDDLCGGGDAGHAVFVALAQGGGDAGDADDEDARVHHLLALLSQEEPEVDETPDGSVALDGQSTVPEPPQSVADALDTTPEGSEWDPQRTPVVATVGLRAFEEPMVRGVALNFLQEDELAPEVEAFAVEVEVPVSVPASGEVSSRQSISLDWAEHEHDDAEDDTLDADAIAVTLEAVAVADADAPEAETEDPASASAADASADDSAAERRKRKPRRPRPAGEKAEGAREARDGKDGRDGRDGKPKVDEDGFEVKTGRRASAARGRGRGRGGAAGGRAPREGGREGQGREGQGGERRAGPKGDNQKGGDKENGGQRRAPRKAPGKDSKDAKPKEAKPKPSIYKAVQPGAPVSAPIH